MEDNIYQIDDDKNLINIEVILNFLARRKKLLIVASSITFLLLIFGSIYKRFTSPVYSGSFSVLIADPIDGGIASRNSIEERLAYNDTFSELPTLLQYLKSEFVIAPVSKELGISSLALRNRISITLDGQKPFIARGILKVSIRGKNRINTQIALEKLSRRFLESATLQRQLRLKSGLTFLDQESPALENKVNQLQNEVESFRKKHNIVDPLDQAKTREAIKNQIELEVNQYKSNMSRLNLIKKDVSFNMLKTNGFFEQLQPDLGLSLTGSDQQLFENYNKLEMDLADAKTKYKKNSSVVKNLEQRLNILFPELKEKQLNTIELAINANKRKLRVSESKLDNLNKEFKIQPELLREYEIISRKLDSALKNLNSLVAAKENFQLQLAQKNLPWRIIESPKVYSRPISPNFKQDTIRGILLSLLLGFSIAILIDLSDKVFHSVEEIKKFATRLKKTFLGSVPHLVNLKNVEVNGNSKGSDEFSDEEKENFLVNESFKSLATSIRFMNINDKKTKSLLVTSAKQGEGKTTVTSYLAKTLVDLGFKVLLIDADMRRPSIHKFFEIDNMVGLSNLITEPKVNLDGIIQSKVSNLDILTSGIKPPDPIYLLSSNRMKTIHENFLSLNYDYVIYDAPPSYGLADAKVLSQIINKILFVVSMNDVNRDSSKEAIRFLASETGDISIISNDLKGINKFNNFYGYYNNYSNNIYKYYSSDDNETKPEKGNKLVNKNLTKLENIRETFKKFLNWLDF